MGDQKNLLRYFEFSLSSSVAIIFSLASLDNVSNLSFWTCALTSSSSKCFITFSLVFNCLSNCYWNLSSLLPSMVILWMGEVSYLVSLVISVFRCSIYLFFSFIFLACSREFSSILSFSFVISVFNFTLFEYSRFGVYIQLYCFAYPSLFFIFFSTFTTFLCGSLSFSGVLHWKSALVMLRIQLEQSWLWKSPDVRILYLVSISLKLLFWSLSLLRNSLTNVWLWLIIFNKTIFYLYIFFIELSYCSFERSYPDYKFLMRV